MRKPLVVCGIDPGTTLGVCVLTLEGGVADIYSAKEHTLAATITRIMKSGRAVAVGCDKASPPQFARHLATKLGARLYSPKEDMSLELKKMLAKGKKFRNTHEFDAAASAFFALKKVREVLNKITKAKKKSGSGASPEDALVLSLSHAGMSSAEALRRTEPGTGEDKKNGKDFSPKEGETRAKSKEKVLRLSYSRLSKAYKEMGKRLREQKRIFAEEVKMLRNANEQLKKQLSLLSKKTKRRARALRRTEEFLLTEKGRAGLWLKNLRKESVKNVEHMLPRLKHNCAFVEDPLSCDNEGIELARRHIKRLYVAGQPAEKLREHFAIMILKKMPERIGEMSFWVPKNAEEIQAGVEKLIQRYREQRRKKQG